MFSNKPRPEKFSKFSGHLPSSSSVIRQPAEAELVDLAGKQFAVRNLVVRWLSIVHDQLPCCNLGINIFMEVLYWFHSTVERQPFPCESNLDRAEYVFQFRPTFELRKLSGLKSTLNVVLY
jgi:hypothetical protein